MHSSPQWVFKIERWCVGKGGMEFVVWAWVTKFHVWVEPRLDQGAAKTGSFTTVEHYVSFGKALFSSRGRSCWTRFVESRTVSNLTLIQFRALSPVNKQNAQLLHEKLSIHRPLSSWFPVLPYEQNALPYCRSIHAISTDVLLCSVNGCGLFAILYLFMWTKGVLQRMICTCSTQEWSKESASRPRTECTPKIIGSSNMFSVALA